MQRTTDRQGVEVNSWATGIITEASPLNFPEGASVEEENFVLNRKKTRPRRLGVEYETGHSLINLEVTATSTGVAINNFLWTNVAENPSQDYLVHQFGNKLYVFDTSASALSTQLLFGAAISLTATSAEVFSFASLQGKLVVSTGDQSVRVINLETTGTYSISYLNLKVRDFWGVADGLEADERTAALSNLHAYNLYNQGWPNEFFSSSDPANPKTMNNGTTEDPIARTFTSLGVYPSNADIIYAATTFLTNGRKAYYPHALENILFGNTPAAKGHYIIDLFNRSQGRVDAYAEDIAKGFSNRINYTSSIITDTSTGGVKAVAAYAGRIWYACSSGESGGDDRSPHVGTFVLFSQLVDSTADIARCYQDADPTAEDFSDLVDTDGGYISLPDAVNIQALIPFGSALLVFAANGVWAVSGGSKGFSATEYQSDFVTNNGVLSKASIITTETAIVYWSRNGVYLLSAQGDLTKAAAGALQPQSLTETSIQDLYNAIPYNSKAKAVGYYDDVEHRARWLYQAVYDADYPHKYTHELIMDFSLPAWNKFSFKDIQTRTPRISGYAPVPIQRRGESNYKYSVLAPQISGTYEMTFAGLLHATWLDWYTADISATSTASRGADAAAYLVTGYVTGGDSARYKQIPYLTVHFARTETGVADEATATATATIAATCTPTQLFTSYPAMKAGSISSLTASLIVQGIDIGRWEGGTLGMLAVVQTDLKNTSAFMRYSSDNGLTWTAWDNIYSESSTAAGNINFPSPNGALAMGFNEVTASKIMAVAFCSNVVSRKHRLISRDAGATWTHFEKTSTYSEVALPGGAYYERKWTEDISGTADGVNLYVNYKGLVSLSTIYWTKRESYNQEGEGSDVFATGVSDPTTVNAGVAVFSTPYRMDSQRQAELSGYPRVLALMWQTGYMNITAWLRTSWLDDTASLSTTATLNHGLLTPGLTLKADTGYSTCAMLACIPFLANNSTPHRFRVFAIRKSAAYGQHIVAIGWNHTLASAGTLSYSSTTSIVQYLRVTNDLYDAGGRTGYQLQGQFDGTRYYLAHFHSATSGAKAIKVIRSTDDTCQNWEVVLKNDTDCAPLYLTNMQMYDNVMHISALNGTTTTTLDPAVTLFGYGRYIRVTNGEPVSSFAALTLSWTGLPA